MKHACHARRGVAGWPRTISSRGDVMWRRSMRNTAPMEDVLNLYGEVPDPKRPVVCFDESPIQLIGEVRPTPGQIERYDCE